jgi:TolB protein
MAGCGGDGGGNGPVDVAETLASFELTATSPCTCGEAFSLTVTAVGNQGSKPFSAFSGSVSLSSSGGTISPSSVALTNGRGSVMVTLDQSGQLSLSASAQGKTGSMSMEVLPEEVLDSFELTTASTPEIGVSFSLQVVAVGDRGTKPLGSFDGTVTLASTKGTVTPASLDLVGGTVYASITLDQEGAQTLTATAAGKTGSLDVNVLPQEVLASFDLKVLGTAMKGQEFLLRVYAVGDRGTNPLTTFSGDVGLETSSGTITPATVNLADGWGSATVTLDEGGEVTLTASAEGKTGSLELVVAPELAGEIVATSDRGGGWDLWKVVLGEVEPVRLTSHSAPEEQEWIAWSPDGTRVAYASKHTGNNEIYVINADGTGGTNITNDPAPDGHGNWSPDGSKLAFASGRDGDVEIFVMNPDGSGVTQLTQNAVFDGFPKWSPDGTKIAWENRDETNGGIYVMDPDGSGKTFLAPGGSPEWSPDGSRVAFLYEGSVHVIGSDGTNPIQLTNDPDRWDGNWGGPSWSPDGSRIAFTASDSQFVFRMYMVNADGSGLTQLTGPPDLAGGWPREPEWSPDGAWICGMSWNEGLGVVHPTSGAILGITPAGAKYWYPHWRPGG